VEPRIGKERVYLSGIYIFMLEITGMCCKFTVCIYLSVCIYFCVALVVYKRSPAALKSFKILQLPSKSLQSYMGAFLHEPGASNQCIEDQYVIFKSKCVKQGKREPQRDGVIIFDEVKVACQLMWNSRSQA